MQGCTDLGLAATSDLRQADRIEISEIGAVYKQLRSPTTPTFPPPRCADSAAKTCRSNRCLGPRSTGSSRHQSKLELSQLTISRQPKELGISAVQAWPHRRGAPAIREMLHLRSTSAARMRPGESHAAALSIRCGACLSPARADSLNHPPPASRYRAPRHMCFASPSATAAAHALR